MTNGTAKSSLLPRWLWLGFPPFMLLLEVSFQAANPQLYRRLFRGETAIIETLTALFAIAGIGLGIYLFRRRKEVGSRWFGPWALFLAAACLVFAGEEMSWGQHLFRFEVPDEIAARNVQKEFNLHNDPTLEPIFDFWARNSLSWGALIGGVVLPIVRRRSGRDLPDPRSASPWDWLLPTMTCLPTALIVCGVTVHGRILRMRQDPTFQWEISWSETKEFYLALLVFIYLLTLARSFRR